MARYLQQELDELKRRILELGAAVEESVALAARACEQRDVATSESIIAGDDRIDAMEVDLEEECLKVLALHQPVANDLRFIVAVLKINNDLERISDLAVNIAERSVSLAKQPPVAPPFDFPKMTLSTQSMLRKSLDALVHQDAELALEVIALDDDLDDLHSLNYRQIKEGIARSPEKLDALLSYLSISRHLERIADLATNIAEDVVYLTRGTIIRHQV